MGPLGRLGGAVGRHPLIAISCWTMLVAVLLDATLVRCLLVPAFMTWQQLIMWWAPRWMKRLHARIGFSES